MLAYFRRDGAKQHTGKDVGVECVGAGCNDEFAELANPGVGQRWSVTLPLEIYHLELS